MLILGIAIGTAIGVCSVFAWLWITERRIITLDEANLLGIPEAKTEGL